MARTTTTPSSTARVLLAAATYHGQGRAVAMGYRGRKALAAVAAQPAPKVHHPTPYGGTLRPQYVAPNATPTQKATALLLGLAPATLAAHGLAASHRGLSPYTWRWRALKVAGGVL